MIYLREIRKIGQTIVQVRLEIFEGDIKKDKKYWKKYQRAQSIRYFELKEIKSEK